MGGCARTFFRRTGRRAAAPAAHPSESPHELLGVGAPASVLLPRLRVGGPHAPSTGRRARRSRSSCWFRGHTLFLPKSARRAGGTGYGPGSSLKPREPFPPRRVSVHGSQAGPSERVPRGARQEGGGAAMATAHSENGLVKPGRELAVRPRPRRPRGTARFRDGRSAGKAAAAAPGGAACRLHGPRAWQLPFGLG
jgi:hypothetical protein